MKCRDIRCLSRKAALCALVLGCGRGPSVGAGEWRGTVDTLASGIVVVSNPRAGIWDSTTRWHLNETVRIGAVNGDGPNVWGRIAALQVDALGRIYVLESQSDEVRVFDGDGAYVRSLGRRGAGPGELANPVGMDWDDKDNLWVVDVGNARFSVFDTEGAYVTQYQRSASFYALPWPGGFDAGGRFLDTGLDPPDKLVLIRYDFEMAPTDTVRIPIYRTETFEIPQQMTVHVPFAPSLVWRFDSRGYIWSVVTGDYRLVQQTLSGDTVRIVEREFVPVQVTEEDMDEAMERLEFFKREGGRIDPSRIPRRKPALEEFDVDPQGYIWVRPMVRRADAGKVFDIFDPDGKYLGRVTSPVAISRFPRPLIADSAVYAVTTDEMDVSYVIRLAIDRR